SPVRPPRAAAPAAEAEPTLMKSRRRMRTPLAFAVVAPAGSPAAGVSQRRRGRYARAPACPYGHVVILIRGSRAIGRTRTPVPGNSPRDCTQRLYLRTGTGGLGCQPGCTGRHPSPLEGPGMKAEQKVALIQHVMGASHVFCATVTEL